MPTPPPWMIRPLLLKAAHHARIHGVAVVIDQTAVALPDPHHLPFPLVGHRVGPRVSIVATRLGWGDSVGPPVILAADRSGTTIVLDRHVPEPLIADDPMSVISDLARRALGLPTPACPQRVHELINTVWLDRIMQRTVSHGPPEKPGWPELFALHPYACPHRSSTRLSAGLRFYGPVPNWSELRGWLIEGRCRWPPASAPLAGWFDDGSLARFCFAVLPDAHEIFTNLCELLRPRDLERVSHTLAELATSP